MKPNPKPLTLEEVLSDEALCWAGESALDGDFVMARRELANALAPWEREVFQRGFQRGLAEGSGDESAIRADERRKVRTYERNRAIELVAKVLREPTDDPPNRPDREALMTPNLRALLTVLVNHAEEETDRLTLPHSDVRELANYIAALSAERPAPGLTWEARRMSLMPYLRHWKGCASRDDHHVCDGTTFKPCDCGLDAALDQE